MTYLDISTSHICGKYGYSVCPPEKTISLPIYNLQKTKAAKIYLKIPRYHVWSFFKSSKPSDLEAKIFQVFFVLLENPPLPQNNGDTHVYWNFDEWFKIWFKMAENCSRTASKGLEQGKSHSKEQLYFWFVLCYPWYYILSFRLTARIS